MITTETCGFCRTLHLRFLFLDKNSGCQRHSSVKYQCADGWRHRCFLRHIREQEKTRDSVFDPLASGQIALRWRIRKARVHESGVKPLRILTAEIVRSRPPTEALGSSDHGPRLEHAHAKAKRSREAWATRRGSAELGLLAEFVTCRVDGVKGGAVSAQPASLQHQQSRRARQRAGPLRDARPGEKPHR